MVATEWAPVVQTAIGAAAGIGGGLLGAWMQGRGQDRIERYRRRERFAQVLADTTALLHETNPRRPHFRYKLSDSSAYYSAIDRRLRSIRARLLLLSVEHPDRRIGDLARRLDEALYEQDSAMGLFLDMMELEQQPATVAKGRAEATDRHEEAARLLADLVKAI
jgi:hypothetical protein